MVSRDRLYSAHVKKNKEIIKKQVKHIKKLLKINKLNVLRMVKQIQKASKLVKKNASLFDLHAISKIRKALVTGKIPRKILIRKLNKLHITAAQRRLAFDVLKSRKVGDKDILILPKLKQLKSALIKSNCLFEKSIIEEVKWYSNV